MVSERKGADSIEAGIVLYGSAVGLFAALVYAVSQWVQDLIAGKGDIYLCLLVSLAILLLSVPAVLVGLRRRAEREAHHLVGEVQKIEA